MPFDMVKIHEIYFRLKQCTVEEVHPTFEY